jgi:hypothetical protein
MNIEYLLQICDRISKKEFLRAKNSGINIDYDEIRSISYEFLSRVLLPRLNSDYHDNQKYNYVYIRVRGYLRDYIKTIKPVEEIYINLLVDNNDPLDNLEKKELFDTLKSIINSLPEESKFLIIEKFYNNREDKEIRNSLKLPRSTYHYLKSNTFKKIRNELCGRLKHIKNYQFI